MAPVPAELNRLVELYDAGHYAEVETGARSLLGRYPDSGLAWKMLGVSLLAQGQDALPALQKAARFLPDDAAVHYNLGNHFKKTGRLDEAEASYRRALYIKPNFVEALNNLALLLDAKGELVTALNIINHSLKIKETAEAKSIFVACAKRLRCTHGSSEARTVMARALTEPWGRPGELMQVSTDLVRLDPDIGACVTRAANAWPLRLSAQDLFGPNGLATLAADTLLCALLDAAPICDIEMERFLTMARRAMLEVVAGMTATGNEDGAVSRFYGALARQCFINEYVFSFTDDEIRKANGLRDSLVSALEEGAQIPSLWPVAVAAYFPLGSLPFAARFLERQWPAEVVAVLQQQVREPEEELQIRTTIPRLTDIEDEVSRLVKSQYEDNPYPRWVKAAPAPKTENIVEYLYQKFPLASLNRYRRCDNPDVLIAGCGTGQHSIQSARQFQGAKVLAIDLSMSSLSYAKRKTKELGLTSIEYAQADLLKLGALGRSFDVIESVGVLHHLADPWAGWRVLLSLLRPGGVMRLGFYSEVARQNIVKARAFIARRGYGTTANEIRRCRQDLMDSGKNTDFWTALITRDFFSISACRDLLFHVQEHLMTLTGIGAFLCDNKLEFLGFEIDASVLNAYKQRFPDDCAATNLEQWQIFENENPNTFYGMYQFWVRKGG